jgi:hypothetical protein
MAEIVPPAYVTYAPHRIAGTWRMHETVGHLRNSLSQNGRQIVAVFRINPDGTWDRFGPSEAFKDDFK